MLHAFSGIVRAITHIRSKGPDRTSSSPARSTTSRHVHRRAIGVARFLAHVLTPTPRSRERAAAHRVATRTGNLVPARPRTSARRRLYRRHLVLRLTSDRTLPIAIGLIVVIAAGVSLAPAASPVGAAQGANAGLRLAIGGGVAGAAVLDGPIVEGTDAGQPSAYVDDGTLYKPVAVDTTIQSSTELLRHYKVATGDTLTGIASRFGVSMMTLWWANNITSKDALPVGQDLIIPPVSGLIYTVQAGDTLDGLAVANNVDVQQIVEVNGLVDYNLIVGQVLVLPGAKGAPIPTPTPTPKPTKKPSTGSGGGNYISQGFHSGHYALDIAATYGTPVVAALAGTVVYAGWASTGCGYQVILRNSASIYTQYCHNSVVTVSKGQTVARGQQIARIGQSGWATGPHVHFAVSIGYPRESGSYFVNPLKYY